MAKSKKKATAPASAPAAKDDSYHIILRTANHPEIIATALDKELYPLTVSWNRVLSALGNARGQWHETSHKAFRNFAERGLVDPALVDPFIKAAAASGVVEVEMAWEKEDTGWAGRLFPWEAMIAMATKSERDKLGTGDFVVIRVLTHGKSVTKALGQPAYAACDGGPDSPAFDFRAELDAIRTSLGKIDTLDASCLSRLAAEIATKQPSIVHLAANDLGKGTFIAPEPGDKPRPLTSEEVAAATASHGPELVVYSSCYSGRRLAPQAIADGAYLALGFQGEVYDESVPLFFGAFYLEWSRTHQDVVASLRAGLRAHNSQRNPSELGGVVLWSASSILNKAKTRGLSAATVPAPATRGLKPIPKKALAEAFRIDFVPRSSLNYSVLHNDRTGLFDTFSLTKKPEGAVPPVSVTVRLHTGVGTPTECRFVVKPGAGAYDFTDLAQRLALPLGAALIRQRGEALQAMLETLVTCGDIKLHEETTPLAILPCDEWRDDGIGQHFLPSFVFPRNPAIRDVISAAQPFLRAFVDTPQAGFDGYQAAFAQGRMPAEDAVKYQVRALWAALQHTLRLDYVNSSPTYSRQSQRLRTPDEVLRSRRGTCIELALLLASCLEHVGIYPVIYLIPGHAFLGYWTSAEAHRAFTSDAAKIVEKARPKDNEVFDPNQIEGLQTRARIVPWRFNARHHPDAILNEIEAGALVAIEATSIPFQQSFQESMDSAKQRLEIAARAPDPLQAFDAMLDVKMARQSNITPLPILVDNIFA